MRCVFSETLKVSTLDVGTGAPPGGLHGAPPVCARQNHAASASCSTSWKTITSPLRTLARGILDDVVTTCFPGDCRACGEPLIHASRVPVCDRCIAAITRQTMTLCRICGEALGMESDRFAGQFPAEGVLCTVCRFVPPPFERAVAYGVYEDEMRELVHFLKYERMRVAAGPLGALLAKAMTSLELEGEIAVVAVPLHPAKERQRGYNQAILLTDAALKVLHTAATGARFHAAHGALIRVRETESQFALNPRMRRLNLRGAFAVRDAAAIAGRTVLLVDDIYTTGATAKECARVLLQGGAERVFVATLARAQAERVEFWTMQGGAEGFSGEVHT